MHYSKQSRGLKTSWTGITTAILAVFITGCAPTAHIPTINDELAAAEASRQRMEAVSLHINNVRRVHDIAFQISKSNVELCGDKTDYLLGTIAFTLDDVGKDWREPIRMQFGVDDRLTVIAVGRGSPAMNAGIKPGDKFISVNGKNIGKEMNSLERLMEIVMEGVDAPLTLTMNRNGKLIELKNIQPTQTCDYPVEIKQDDRVNAYADGTKIYLTTGMLRFAESDDDLALIIGHELAHNTRNHMDSKVGNMLIGAIIGVIATGVTGVDMTQLGADVGGAAFSQEFEAEADYVGVYHAARAGYNVKDAAALWRRMAIAHPQAIHLAGSSHPSTAKRFLAIQIAADEVERKRSANTSLIPNEKSSVKSVSDPKLRPTPPD